jgi:hypothetical protein
MTLTHERKPEPLLTHAVNVFSAHPESQHVLAQAVTLETIQRAKDAAKNAGIDVEVVAVCYEEDRHLVQEPWTIGVLPNRSILDFGTFAKPRRYPLLGDILIAAQAAGRGRFLTYSNIDIAVQPQFYVRLAEIVQRGGATNGVVINRRTIGAYGSISALEAMYADPGKQHPGYDCWTFPREWVSRMVLGSVCVGHFWFDLLLLANVSLLGGNRLLVLKDQQWTFHIGDDVVWNQQSDYSEHNRLESLKAVQELARREGVKPYGTWADWLELKTQGQKTKVRRLLLEARRQAHLVKLAVKLGRRYT